MINIADFNAIVADNNLRNQGFSFDGLGLTTSSQGFTHPDLPPGCKILVTNLIGDAKVFATALASQPIAPTAQQKLVTFAVAQATGKEPLAYAVLQAIEMLERSIAETRERVNELAKRMNAAGIKTNDLPDLFSYQSFADALNAWKTFIAAN